MDAERTPGRQIAKLKRELRVVGRKIDDRLKFGQLQGDLPGLKMRRSRILSELSGLPIGAQIEIPHPFDQDKKISGIIIRIVSAPFPNAGDAGDDNFEVDIETDIEMDDGVTGKKMSHAILHRKFKSFTKGERGQIIPDALL